MIGASIRPEAADFLDVILTIRRLALSNYRTISPTP
jgi:hypothetical protein